MRNVLFAALIGAIAATTTWAQTPAAPAGRERVVQVIPAQPAPPAPAAVPATTAPQFANPPRNIRFDISITETGGAKPITKTISLTVNDSNGSGSVRSLVNSATVRLNVDVRAVQAFDGGVVRAAVNVEYQPYTPDASAPSSGIQSSITSMFQDGRRTQILQSSDPFSDRRTTIDVTATVLK